MQFFKLVGAFAAGSGGQVRKRTADENVDLLAAKSEAFNKGLRGRAFFYVVNASGGTFTAMAVQKDPRMNMNPQFPAYMEALGVKLTDIHAEEISLHAACNLLHRASRSDYIEDDDDVLKMLDLDYMVNRRFSDFCFREDLIDEACRDEIYAKAGRLFTKDCLLPELDRIYAGGSFGKIVGHPVHYLIQTDDAGIRREMIQALLPSLYANGRLQNRRYSSVRFRGEVLHGESSAYDQFYKSNAGGTVIVQYSADYGDIDDEDTADGIRDTIEKLCSYIKKYRHQVLTIEDLENQVLTYAQVKALALAEPLMKQLAEKENEVKNLKILLSRERQTLAEQKKELAQIDEKIKAARQRWETSIAAADALKKYDADARKSAYQRIKSLLTDDFLISGNALQMPMVLGMGMELPERQDEKKPYILLKYAEQKYLVPMGDTPAGNARRVINALKEFQKFADQDKEHLDKVVSRKEELQSLAQSPDHSYSDQLAACEKEASRLREQIAVRAECGAFTD